MQNNRTQQLILCVLLSLVVHAGLAATFISAIQPKSERLEIFKPIHVSLIQNFSDEIGTAANQSIESNLNQFPVPGDQRKPVDLNQSVEITANAVYEANDELESVVVSSNTDQSTDFTDMDQPPSSSPDFQEEVIVNSSKLEFQPPKAVSSTVSSNTGQLPEQNELESIEVENAKAEVEPMSSEPVSEWESQIAESVETLASQMTDSRIDDGTENWTRTVYEPVSDITSLDVPTLSVQSSLESTDEISDADELAGIWNTEAIELATLTPDQPPTYETTTAEFEESVIQSPVASVAEIPDSVSTTTTETAQVSVPDFMVFQFLESEKSAAWSTVSKVEIGEQLTDNAPSEIIQITDSSINIKIQRSTETDHQPVSDNTPAETSSLPDSAKTEPVADIPDADELAGIWNTEAIELATLQIDRPRSSEIGAGESEKLVVEVAGISVLSESSTTLTRKSSQVSPSDIPVIEQGTELVSTSTEDTVYFETEYMAEANDQLESNIVSAEASNLPKSANAEPVTNVPDADDLAGIWNMVAIELATLTPDQPPSYDTTTAEFEESVIQSLVVSIAEMSMSDPVSKTTSETAQTSLPDVMTFELLASEKSSTPRIETKAAIDELLTDTTPSEIIQFTDSTIDAKIERSTETDHQPVSDITPAEASSLPELANAELGADIPDADELAGIWNAEAVEPAVVDSEHLPSREMIPAKIIESRIQVASAINLIEPVQYDFDQVEPEHLPAPTFLESGINPTKSDLDKETTYEKTIDLNNVWLNDQLTPVTDQLAYASKNPEQAPIQEETLAAENPPLDDGIQLKANSTDSGNEKKAIQPKENETEATPANQPQFYNSSPSAIEESSNRTDLAETDEKLIPKKRRQVASVDSVQQTVNSGDQSMSNSVTQKTALDGISSDVGPKFGIEGLPNQAPRYPYLSRVNDEQGRVILRVVVDRKGRAKEVMVLESSGYSRLDKAARKAVKRWRFQPAQKNGQSTQGVVQIPINFLLDSS